MYQRILVPLDGSERAERVLPHAIEIARGKETRLLLLHVVEPPVVTAPAVAPGVPATSVPIRSNSLEDGLTRALEEAKSYLDQKKGEIEAGGTPCETSLEQGGVVERIVSAAEAKDVDLVAMASHGRSGLATVFFGSVAIGVLHRLERPILLIRADGE